MLLACKYEEVAVPMVEDLVLFFGFGPFGMDVYAVWLGIDENFSKKIII
jgi:hypothetical protein